MSKTEVEPETAREDGKIFVPGFGWMTPGVCTPSYCSEGHGGKCMRRCLKDARRKRMEKRK